VVEVVVIGDAPREQVTPLGRVQVYEVAPLMALMV
jgi:hypothetical protein